MVPGRSTLALRAAAAQNPEQHNVWGGGLNVPMPHPQAMSPRSSLMIGATLLVATLAACDSTVSYPSASAGVTTTSGQQLERQRQQARDDLTRWADAVAAAGGQQGFVLVGEATGQVGDWEEPVGSNNKVALMAGKVVAAVALSDQTPPPGRVHWKDGSVRTLPTISAAQALKDLQESGVQDCPDCDELRVTGARLIAVGIDTSRGPATVPAWEFSLEGTAVQVTRVAISAGSNVSVSPPPWDPDDPPVGISIWAASGTVDGRQITVTFGGSPYPGTEPCGADYTAEAVESQTAVVVIVIEHRNLTADVACDLVGRARTATVQLAAPLGDRAVLEVKEGLPVPVTLTP